MEGIADRGGELLSRAIIVIGAGGRTGTGTLALHLSHHPELAYADEPRVVWRWGNERKSDMLRREDARPAVKRHIRNDFARRVREAGARRLLEKTPGNSLRMEFVEEVLPDCRFVHILRDGRDAVLGISDFWDRHATGLTGVDFRKRLREASLSQLPHYGLELARRLAPGLVGKPIWGPRIPAIRGLMRELDPLEVAALQWRTCVEAACHYGRALPPHRYMEVRLEDLSHETYSEILAFCELDDHPAVHEAFDRHFDGRLPSARRARADAELVARIDRWILPTQRWLGYA